MAAARERRIRRLPITTLLVGGVGGIVCIGIATVLWIALAIGVQNTVELLRENGLQTVGSVEDHLTQHLGPSRQQVEFLAERVGRTPALVDDLDRLAPTLLASMAATPQVAETVFLRDDLTALSVERDGKVEIEKRTGEPELATALSEGRARREVYWGEPVFDADLGQTLINVRMPVVVDQTYRGLLASVVTASELSRFLATQATPDVVPFVLYGPTHVLAHPALAEGGGRASRDQPLPTLGEVGDPVLGAIWSAENEGSLIDWNESGLDGHSVDFAGHDFLFLYKTVYGLGPEALRVGVHIDLDVAGLPVVRLMYAGGVGLAILILAVGLALWLGRMIARPVQALAAGADAIADLDLDAAPRLRHSHIAELDRAALAFNHMVAGLRWFEFYVPQSLVRRLLRSPSRRALPSEERSVTVLFTDIALFTSACEGLPAAAVAERLNRHFALINACIEAEDGTIDKYIGDSVMAFWGAPGEQPDHAARACRAALAIADVVIGDNRERAGRGEAPEHVRVGLHSGPVIAGNIGSPGRINYTLIGDTVNVANRLEQLGKEIAPDDEACVLISEETRHAAGAGFATTPIGERQLRGRRDALLVHRLV